MLGIIIFLIVVGFIGLIGYAFFLIGSGEPVSLEPKDDIPENWPFPTNKP